MSEPLTPKVTTRDSQGHQGQLPHERSYRDDTTRCLSVVHGYTKGTNWPAFTVAMARVSSQAQSVTPAAARSGSGCGNSR